MQLFIAVGSASASFVLTEALSASSSRSNNGYSILLLPNSTEFLSQAIRFSRMRLFFFTTKRTVLFKLFKLREKLSSVVALKSEITEVNCGISFFMPYLAAPTALFLMAVSALERKIWLSRPASSKSKRA